MAGAYDRGRQPNASHDPTKTLQWQIQKAVAGLWDSIVQAIEAAMDTVKEWASQFFDAVFGALVGLDTEEVLALLISDPLAFIPRMLTRLISHGLLGKNSPLNAFNIFGLLQSWNLPFLPIGSLTDKQPNLFVAPGFTDADSIDQVDQMNGWSHDPTDGRTNPGCARVDVLGGLQQILQSVPIPVAEGQEIKAHVYVKWGGLTYTGTNPIAVDLVRFDENGMELSKTTLASLANPAASSGADWYKIDCPKYTIPPGDTSQIILQLRLMETATGGFVKWDDAELKKVNNRIPQNWILNLVPDLGGIRDWIQDLIDGIISAIRGIPFVGGTLAELILDITGWQEDTDDAAAQAADAYIGLGVTQKIITAAATGTDLPPEVITTPEDEVVQTALVDQTQVIVATAAKLAELDSQFVEQVNSGVREVDTFEEVRIGDLNPALWEKYVLEGVPADIWMETKNGHDANMGWANTDTGTVIYRFLTPTLTNYQKVTATVASGMPYAFLDGRRPHMAAVCRMSADGTKWVRAYFTNKNRLVVDYRNGAASGVLWQSADDQYGSPGPGSSVGIEAGFGTNEYAFRIWRGNTPLRVVEDNDHVTDPTPLFSGLGGRVASGWGPGSFTQFTVVDNKPAPVPGTYLHVARLTTASSSIAEGADINVFSASPIKQNGIDWNGTVATVRTSDTYTIVLRIKHNSYISNSNQDSCILGIEVDGVLQPLGPSLANGIGGLVGNQPYLMRINALYATWTLPLNAGQTVQPVLYSNNNTSFPCVGDPEGILSYMMLTRT